MVIKKLIEYNDINVSGFSFNLKNWLCINISNEIQIYDTNLNKLNKEFVNVNFGIFYNNTFWVSNSITSETFIYKEVLDRNYIKKHNFIAGFNGGIDRFTRNKSFLANGFKGSDYSKTYYFELEKKSFNLLFEYVELGFNGIYQVINDNLFLSQNNEKFGVFTFENQCVWECYYKDLFKDYEPIGAGTTNILKVGNKLYVELGKTYCIDIETGVIENTYNYSFTYAEKEYLYCMHPRNNKRSELYILNTITQKIQYVDVTEALEKNIFPDQRFVVQNGLIYFKQSMGDVIARLGILDPKTAKLIWKYDFPKGSGGVGTLKVNGNRIYAHTQDKTLHIFEKQENETV